MGRARDFHGRVRGFRGWERGYHEIENEDYSEVCQKVTVISFFD